jgi:hypothetical protein
LEELVNAIVDGIAVHAQWLRPGGTLILRVHREKIHIAVAKVGPGQVQISAQFAFARIHTDLGKPIARDTPAMPRAPPKYSGATSTTAREGEKVLPLSCDSVKVMPQTRESSESKAGRFAVILWVLF